MKTPILIAAMMLVHVVSVSGQKTVDTIAISKEAVKALIEAFKDAPAPVYLDADLSERLDAAAFLKKFSDGDLVIRYRKEDPRPDSIMVYRYVSSKYEDHRLLTVYGNCERNPVNPCSIGLEADIYAHGAFIGTEMVFWMDAEDFEALRSE